MEPESKTEPTSSSKLAPKLTPDNWMVFEMQMTSFLDNSAKALTKDRPVIDADAHMALLDEVRQPTAKSVKFQRKFKEKSKKFKSANRRAMKALIESIRECRSSAQLLALEAVANKDSAKKLWTALKQRFNDQTETSLTYHIGIFNQLKAKGGETRIDFVERLTEHLIILRGMHYEVSEATKIERLLNGLSNIKDYQVEARSLELIPNVTGDMIVSKLRAWDRAQQNNSATLKLRIPPNLALFVTRAERLVTSRLIAQTKSIRTENSRNSNVEAEERGAAEAEVRETKAVVEAEVAAAEGNKARAEEAAILAVANEAEAAVTRTSFATAARRKAILLKTAHTPRLSLLSCRSARPSTRLLTTTTLITISVAWSPRRRIKRF
jgi:hypothetical protein